MKQNLNINYELTSDLIVDIKYTMELKIVCNSHEKLTPC
ncbi:hypothetical protein VPUCM_1482 [Vibrio parahaemolyticus UCM-V493]|nr:hypothetical protein VPUCM_1482 [Vibrio parahaemolyticus UCM-V493]